MKKVFIIAAAACVTLASCVKNEPVQTPNLGEAIKFEAPIVAPSTKADTPVGTVQYPVNSKFFLYGWYHASADPDAFENIYIPGVEVQKSGSNSWFAPTTTYYWPKSGLLSFFAYSPSAPTGTLNVSQITTAKSVALTYTVSQTPTAAGDDLLYSDWAVNKTSTNSTTTVGDYTGVEIVFNHALSAVVFNFTGAENMYKITGVSLQGVGNSSTLTCTPTSAAWAEPTTMTTTYNLGVTGQVSGTAISSNQFVLLPQTFTNTAKLVVSYSIKNPSKDEWIIQTPAEILLNSAKDGETAISKWQMGKKYTYNVVFGEADVIKFAPSIKTDWVGVSGNFATIQ